MQVCRTSLTVSNQSRGLLLVKSRASENIQLPSGVPTLRDRVGQNRLSQDSPGQEAGTDMFHGKAVVGLPVKLRGLLSNTP